MGTMKIPSLGGSGRKRGRSNMERPANTEKIRRLFGSLSAMIALTTAPLASLAHEGEEDEAVPIQDVIGDVGDVSFPISCEADGAQATFDRGVALLHHMTYEVAEREFAKMAKADPACAMAHWGIAMTLIHPVWPGQPTAEVLARGTVEIERARALRKTEREAAYVEALAAFYDDWEEVDHWTRIRRWDEAQTGVRERYPNDDEALALAAVIHIAASPKEDLEYRFNRESGAQLESLRTRRPRHPGAIHYLIHAYDNPPLAEQALAAARSYDSIAPEVPHALHMPTHIFTRLGLWVESVSWNIRSREAARKLIVDGAIYSEFAHASDYMTYAYLQAGQDADARRAREVLFAAPRIQDGFVAAYAYAAVSARIEMELGDWKGAAAITPRRPHTISWDDYPSCEAIVHFARGIGAARSGQLEGARASAARLDRLARILEAEGLPYWTKQTLVQKQAVEAWIHHAEGRTQEALIAMEEAANAEDALDKHPVTPGAVLPARELYADMMFGEERFGEALAAYEATLRISPNRFNSLAGAGRAAEGAGRRADARRYFTRLLEIAGNGDTSRPGLVRARAMVSAHVSEN
jgi:tetratricopeptide (TPR) repeat protein